jgi:hypothetical protein
MWTDGYSVGRAKTPTLVLIHLKDLPSVSSPKIISTETGG